MKFLVMILLLSASLHAQDQRSDRYGITGAFGMNMHSADFTRLPDCPSCSPGYFNGSGSGFTYGLQYEHVLDNRYALSAMLVYHSLNGKFTSLEKTTIIAAGVPTPGEFEHTLDATLGTLGIEPTLRWTPGGDFCVKVGLNLSYLLVKNYRQSEKITQPSEYGTFLNPDGSNSFSRERNTFSGSMQAASALFLAPVISLSYSARLNRQGTLFLEPFGAYYVGGTNIVGDDAVKKWKVNSLTFGLSLMYSPAHTATKPAIEKEEWHIDTLRIVHDSTTSALVIGQVSRKSTTTETDEGSSTTHSLSRTDTLFVPKQTIQASITAVGVDSGGREVPNPTFIIEEFIANRLDPLLPYIFFEEGSGTIPERYIRLDKQHAQSFSVQSLYRDSTLKLYLNILNIIGKRLSDNPLATITLVGCNADIGAEKGQLTLSEQRAMSVRNYLWEVWNIDEKRVRMGRQGLPDKASTPKNEPDKMAENRRVEIYSDNPNILEPIFIEKIDRTANPPAVRFHLRASSPDSPLSDWTLSSYQASARTQGFDRHGNGSVPQVIDWKLADNQTIAPQLDEEIRSELQVRDSAGSSVSVPGNNLKVAVRSIQKKRREVTGNYENDRYSLILFDFNKTSIEGNNIAIVRFISSRIKKNSKVSITGYADRTGDAGYVRALSLRRANATRDAVQRADAATVGVGSDIILYDNNLPEGRFYSRAVVIDVQTPMTP